jgi:hypothetical protein
MVADVKYAIRMLVKTPGFTVIAVITLALGMGAATSIFSVVGFVLLRPLPYPQQERIVELSEVSDSGRAMPFAEPNFDDLRARSRSFEAFARYSAYPEAVAGGNEAVRTNVCAASADFFRVLGIAPHLGRLFTDAKPQQVVVVSYGFWKRILGGETNLDALTLRFDNRSFEVIGVLPPHLEFPPQVNLWFPAELMPVVESRTAHNWRVLAAAERRLARRSSRRDLRHRPAAQARARAGD